MEASKSEFYTWIFDTDTVCTMLKLTMVLHVFLSYKSIWTSSKLDIIRKRQDGQTSISSSLEVGVFSRYNWLNKASSKHLNKGIKDLDLSLCTETKVISISYVICTKTSKVAYQVDS